MAVKTKRKPKVQRGVSLAPETYEAICETADRLGRTWNEVAEGALWKAFVAPINSRNKAVSSRTSGDGQGNDLVELAE